MPTVHLHTQTEDSISSWDKALYAFLAEKERRSGSSRTVQSYSRMLADCFGRARNTPDQLTSAEVLAWAHGVGLSGRKPSAVTTGARIACLSIFYRFLIRMGAVTANPCDALERPKSSTAPARGLSGDDVRRLLAVIPDTVPGRRDRAIILTLVLTGRRRAEVVNLKAGDLTVEGSTAFYAYRGKGGKRGRRELPAPAFDAIQRTLADCGKRLETMQPDESLWQAGTGSAGITSGTVYLRFRQSLKDAGLQQTGLHVLRHTAAKLRREAGESVEAVSQFLDHSSLAVTTVYLRRLEGSRDTSWEKVAGAIGIGSVSLRHLTAT